MKTGDSDQLTHQVLGDGETATCCASTAEPVALGRGEAVQSGCC